MLQVFFLDIDDCLIETSRLGKEELSALYTALKRLDIPRSREITAEFEKSFHRLYDLHQEKLLSKPQQEELEKYLSRLYELQAEIITKWGQVKKWSRECFIFIAAEKYGVKLDSQQTAVAAENLWKSIAGHTPFYVDAKRFLHKLIAQKIPFYLISSSDCRLTFNDKKKLFEYDWEYSKKLKLQRLEKLIRLGIPHENIFLGDPYDKPDPWVFRQALTKAKKDIPGVFHSVMIGDSPKNDLEPALKIGMDKFIWINRHKKAIAGSKFNTVAGFDEIAV